MTWVGALISAMGAVIGGVIAALVAQFLQRRRFLHERLIERYSELAGVAALEIDRANSVASLFAIGDLKRSEDQKRLRRQRRLLGQLLQQRIDFRRDLARLSLQIRLLEGNPGLRQKVRELCDKQPFIFPGEFGEGNFSDRFDRFKAEIAEFKDRVEALIKDAVKEHGARALLLFRKQG
jgi:hypothetical protein